MKNKYLLFYGLAYYPHGGMWDFKGAFETEKLAKDFLDKRIEEMESYEKPDWAHIIDVENLKIVYLDGNSCYGRKDGLIEMFK